MLLAGRRSRRRHRRPFVVRVAVVQVGAGGMPVHQRPMPVPVAVAVRFPARIVRPVGAPMVLVVNVRTTF
jgi:hypothetical protein